jgi:hypothetical protein
MVDRRDAVGEGRVPGAWMRAVAGWMRSRLIVRMGPSWPMSYMANNPAQIVSSYEFSSIRQHQGARR